MLIQIWIALFVVASACTYFVLVERLPTIVGAAAGIALWIVLALGALNLVVVDGGGVAVRETNEVLSFLAIGGLVVNTTYLFADATGQLSASTRGLRGES